MKPINLCVIMDPIEQIHSEKDTTFALMIEAQKRKWNIFYLTQEQLYLEKNNVIALSTPIEVYDKKTDFYRLLNSTPSAIPLHEFDIVLMRKDPPFDKRFLYTTYLLDIAQKKGCLIINNPESIRSCNEKLFTAWFPQCTPETLVTSHAEQLIDFLKTHQKIIIKPLSHMGGYGIILLSLDNPNIYSSIELLTKRGRLPIMAQRYIPEITQGDKRILMINGKPYPYCLARLPRQGDIRGNISAGAKTIAQALSKRDRWIANEIGPTLKQKGLCFVGLDIIGDYLTEINVTSPTCVREIEAACRVNICEVILDCFFKLRQNVK